MKLKILVAAHKPNNVYHDDVYTPIHVGRAISKYKDEMSWMIGDDTGDNISEKNKTFCELTAVYWAWKNLKDVEYIGLAHYRRYFETKFTNDNIDKFLKKCDVVLAKPILRDKHLDDKLAKVLCLEDYIILLSTIKRLYPDYEQSCIDYLFDYVDISLNMFIMKYDIFEEYEKFLFKILFECEKYMKIIPYTCSSRRFGYIAEFLLPIFCFHNNLKIRYENVVSMIGERSSVTTNWKQKLKIKLLHHVYDKHIPHCFEQMYDDSVCHSLILDDIEL